MADADDSYDFTDLDGFVDRLRRGFKLVMGNRFQGRIKPGAMPILNRYLGIQCFRSSAAPYLHRRSVTFTAVSGVLSDKRS